MLFISLFIGSSCVKLDDSPWHWRFSIAKSSPLFDHHRLVLLQVPPICFSVVIFLPLSDRSRLKHPFWLSITGSMLTFTDLLSNGSIGKIPLSLSPSHRKCSPIQYRNVCLVNLSFSIGKLARKGSLKGCTVWENIVFVSIFALTAKSQIDHVTFHWAHLVTLCSNIST